MTLSRRRSTASTESRRLRHIEQFRQELSAVRRRVRAEKTAGRVEPDHVELKLRKISARRMRAKQRASRRCSKRMQR
jgi:hypothetical protein